MNDFHKWVIQHNILDDYDEAAIALAKAAFDYGRYLAAPAVVSEDDIRRVAVALEDVALTLYRHLERPRQSDVLRRAKETIAWVKKTYP